MLDRGINVGLATDGANSSDALNMLLAMRLASYVSRAFATSRDRWLECGQNGPAWNDGRRRSAGAAARRSHRAGALADLVFLDLRHVDSCR